jgi:PAS domain S-box-containing protein
MTEPIRIVLVDDAPDVRSLVRTRLRLTKRFDVVGEGATGREAVDRVIEHRPDLLLLDVSMPDMDGLDALARLRELVPETRIVIFSGFEEHGLADRARDLGAADFVEKSVSMEELIERLLAAAAAPADVEAEKPTPAGPEPVLQEHLERFRAAFDQAAIGMATLTLTGRVVRANDALLRMARVDALVGRPYDSMLTDDERTDFNAAVTEVASGNQDLAGVEHRLGDRIVVSTIAVIRDSSNAPLYLFLQVQDVTDRRMAEEELRQSEERFRLLVEGVGDYAIFMLDPTGHIVSWNLGAQRAKGYSAEEIIGQHFSVFYPREAVESNHPQHELEIAAAEGRYEEEGIRIRKDGSTFWANVVITAIRDASGKLVGFAKVTRDVTERNKLLEGLEAAAAERTQLLAVTAHELRTPVAVVKGFVSTLDQHWDELDEAERRDMIAALSRSGERLGRLVDDLFTSARLEAGAMEMRITTFELGALVREVVSDVGSAGIIVEVGDPVHVSADRLRTQQMVANYITNADRYGAPPIIVTVVAHGDMGRVVVTDAGPGVSDALRPQLFGKFASGGSKEGSGLGLFIVRELARAQRGEAWYDPGADGGARFTLALPLARTTT